MTVAARRPHELTQADVYDLWARYGGYLNAVERNVVNRFLEEMAYAEQQVQDVRADAGDRLYHAALSALRQLIACAATASPEMPPPSMTYTTASRRRSQREIIASKAAERREASRYGDLVTRALRKKTADD